VAAVRACAALCGAALEGVEVGARRFAFDPGGAVRVGRFTWHIGTAGSTTMLALGILPLACLAQEPMRARIRGGVFPDFAPSPDHLAPCECVGLLRRATASTRSLRHLGGDGARVQQQRAPRNPAHFLRNCGSWARQGNERREAT
jgi:RNA 3'-terminal phosphate cyclase